MVRNRVNFLLVCLLLVTLLVIVNTKSVLIVMITFAVFVLSELVLFGLSNKQYQIEITLEMDRFKRNQAVGTLNFKSDNRLPSNQVLVELSVKNQLTKEESRHEISLSSVKGQAKKIDFQLASQYCGAVEVAVVAVTYYDLLGLVKHKGEAPNASQTFLVLPELTEMTIDNLEAWHGQDLAELVQNKKGFDPGEIYDFKTYEIGDAVKNIHWKLSAKAQELIVKELSEPSDQSQFILLETSYSKKDSQGLAKVIDGLMTIYLSLSQSLIDHSIAHSIAWFDSNQKHLHIVQINTVEDLRESLPKLLAINFSIDAATTLNSFQQSEYGQESNIIYVAPYHELLKVGKRASQYICLSSVSQPSAYQGLGDERTHLLDANNVTEELIKIVL